MGTSTRNKGQSGYTPLVPSWLEGGSLSPSEPSENQPCGQDTGEMPDNGDPTRFTGPRRIFSQYITSGGRNRAALENALSRYVGHAIGNSANAVTRLGRARQSTAQLFGILQSLTADGNLQTISPGLSVADLAGLPAKQFFLKIAEYVCPDGGPNDEGLARAAYFDAISDCSELENKTTAQLTPEECTLVLRKYMAFVVMERILNDIANRIIILPQDIEHVSMIEDQVKQVISQSIEDAFARTQASPMARTSGNAKDITDKVYQDAFDILKELGE